MPGPVSTLSFVAINVALGVVATWLLPARRPVLLVALMVAFGVPGIVRSPLLDEAPLLRGVCYLVNFGVLPYLFWEAPRLQRLACATLLILIELFTEAYILLAFLAVGIPLDRQFVTPAHDVVRFSNVLIILALGWLFSHLVRRRTREDARTDWSAAASRRHQDASYLLFLGPQILCSVVCSFVVLATLDRAAGPYLVLLTLVVLCLAADAATLVSMRLHARAVTARERSRSLESQLETHVEAVRAMRGQAEAAARFRHDQRSHLQALGALVELGETGRALAYVRALRGGRRL